MERILKQKYQQRERKATERKNWESAVKELRAIDTTQTENTPAFEKLSKAIANSAKTAYALDRFNDEQLGALTTYLNMADIDEDCFREECKTFYRTVLDLGLSHYVYDSNQIRVKRIKKFLLTEIMRKIEALDKKKITKQEFLAYLEGVKERAQSEA